MFRYPVTAVSVLAPCAVAQVQPEALQLPAAPERAAGPHFADQPAGGRQGPPQPGTAGGHASLETARHGHVCPHVPH